MKTILRTGFTISFLWISTALHAQWINSITIHPASPSSLDTLTLLAECSFPSAGCSDHTKYFSIVGNDIYANAIHCLGPMTVICNFTDTFKIDPLPAGNFTFHLQVDGGFGPSPCTPGIVPGPIDSVSFVVSPFTDIQEFIGQDEVYAFPNPVKDRFQIVGLSDSEFPVQLEIFSISGKSIKNLVNENVNYDFNISELPGGIYNLHIETSTNKMFVIQLLKTK